MPFPGGVSMLMLSWIVTTTTEALHLRLLLTIHPKLYFLPIRSLPDISMPRLYAPADRGSRHRRRRSRAAPPLPHPRSSSGRRHPGR